MISKLKEIVTNKRFKFVVKVIIIIIVFFKVRSILYDVEYETAFDQTFTSPKETNTIIVRYDYLGRPDVFLNDKYGSQIFKNSTPGIKTGPQYEVEWISEYKFRLFSDHFGEEYVITIPNK